MNKHTHDIADPYSERLSHRSADRHAGVAEQKHAIHCLPGAVQEIAYVKLIRRAVAAGPREPGRGKLILADLRFKLIQQVLASQADSDLPREARQAPGPNKTDPGVCGCGVADPPLAMLCGPGACPAAILILFGLVALRFVGRGNRG